MSSTASLLPRQKAGISSNPPYTRRPARKSKKSWLSWLTGLTTRLAIWYVLITVFFRCPSTVEECGPESPPICKPYFQARDAITPYVQPVYTTHVQPYVQIVQPYYDLADRYVIANVKQYAVQYATPVTSKAYQVASDSWETHAQPQIQRVQGALEVQYNRHLAAHVDKLTEQTTPLVESSRIWVGRAYEDVLRPVYARAQPYVVTTYQTTRHFTAHTAVPALLRSGDYVYQTFSTSIWPHVRSVYLESVEPQLARIGDRLRRHTPLHNSRESASTSLVHKPAPVSTSSSVASESSSTVLATPSMPAKKESTPIPRASPNPIDDDPLDEFLAEEEEEVVAMPEENTDTSASLDASPSDSVPEAAKADKAAPQARPQQPSSQSDKATAAERREKARKIVAEDLKEWQDRFVKAAEESATEMETQIDDIALAFGSSELMAAGLASVDELRAEVDRQVSQLRTELQDVVRQFSADDADAKNAVNQLVRKTAKSIKAQANPIRDWRATFEEALHSAVTGAADDHFKTLGTVRDLAMQKIGMKWAWMDGVTYKDWAQYHQLKENFDNWTQDLKNLVVTNPSLLRVQDEAGDVEQRALDVARAAAQTLSQLKAVTALKIQARDDSDEFSLEAVQQLLAAKQEEERLQLAEQQRLAEQQLEEQKEAERQRLQAQRQDDGLLVDEEWFVPFVDHATALKARQTAQEGVSRRQQAREKIHVDSIPFPMLVDEV